MRGRQCCWVKTQTPFEKSSLNDFTGLCTVSTTHQIQYFSIKQRAGPRDHKGEKNAVMFASSIDSGARSIRLSISKIQPVRPHFSSLLLLTPYICKVSRSLCHCCPFGEQFLLQVVFLTPCVHDHVTTPTRGWWKITSLQATGIRMVLAVCHIIPPPAVPA